MASRQERDPFAISLHLRTYGCRTDRYSGHYEHVFKLKEKELEGKTILDVGAGDSDFYEQAAIKFQANVVRIDPDYQELPPQNPDSAIAAGAQSLPFKDGSFDLVLASYSLLWISKDQGLRRALRELIRVTKPGGKIKICPATFDKNVDLPVQASFISYDPVNSLTLEISKDPALKPEEWDAVVSNIYKTIHFIAPSIYDKSIDRSAKSLYALANPRKRTREIVE